MPANPVPRFDQFYRHDELTRLLQDYAAAAPDLVQLRSIGRSHEGRDIWLRDADQRRHRAPTPTSRRSGSTATSTPPS